MDDTIISQVCLLKCSRCSIMWTGNPINYWIQFYLIGILFDLPSALCGCIVNTLNTAV